MQLFILSALLHGYIGWRILPALDFPGVALAFGASLGASALLTPFGLWARRVRHPAWSDRLAWIGLGCMGLFSSLLVLTVLRDVSMLVAWTVHGVWPLFSFERFASATASS